MSLPRRKRLEYRLLRWQARFESAAFNRWAPWGLALVLGVIMLLVVLARSRELSEGSGLASAMQTVWLINGGYTPDASLLSHNYLFEQAGLLIYPVAGLAGIFPTAITLLIIQSAALAIAVVPLWRMARQIANLRVGSTIGIVIVYGAYSAIHTVNLSGFHLEVLALPALLAAMYNGLRRRWTRYGLMIALVLLARADLGLAVAGLGILWWVEGERKAGYITSAVGIIWASLAILIVQPLYGGGDFPHVEAFAAYGSGNPFSVLWGVTTSPVTFVQELFSETNFRTVVSLLAPVLFLPVMAPRYLLPAIPVYSLYLVADVPVGQLEEAGQLVPVIAFVFVALVFGLAKTGRVVVQKVNLDRRVVGALVMTAAVFFVRDAVTSPYEEPWAWGRQDGVDEARLDAAEIVPDDAVVRAGPKVLPLITERIGLFQLEDPGEESGTNLADEAAAGVNWIVFDGIDPEWEPIPTAQFCFRLLNQGWVPVARDRGIVVYTFRDEATRLDLPIAALDDGQTCPGVG